MKSGTPSSYLIFAVLVAALSGLLFGYDTGVIAGALLFIRDHFNLDMMTLEMLVSMVLVGAIMGAWFSGKLADWFGRRNLLLLCAYIFIVGALSSGLAYHLGWLLVGRFLIGIAIGISSYTAPLYISEIAPEEHRGKLVILNIIAITGGMALAYAVDYCLSPSAGWRWMLALGALPAVVLGLGLAFLPESPRWMAWQGFITEGKQNLLRLRSSATEAGKEWQAILQSVENEKNHAKRGIIQWISLFQKPFRGVFLLGIALACTQQLCGINAILYYTPLLLKMVNFHKTSTLLISTFGIGLMNFLMTWLAFWLADRWGRRPMLMVGLSGSAFCMAMVATLSPMTSLGSFYQYTLLSFLLLFIACYAMSIGCLFWLIIAEIYPLAIRNVAMSLTTMANWATNLLVTANFISLAEKITLGGVFWCFAAFTLVGFLICLRYLPETKEVALETIESNVLKNVALKNLGG